MCMTFVNDDYEEAASILDEIITSSSPGDSQDKFVARVQSLVTGLAMHPINDASDPGIFRGGNISRSCTFSAHLLSKNTLFVLLSMLPWKMPESSVSVTSVPSKASKHHPRIHRHPSSTSGVPRDLKSTIRNFDRIYARWSSLKDFSPGICNNDITNIDEAIEKGRTILASSDPNESVCVIHFELFGRSSLKHSSAQRRSSTLTSRLAHAVKFLSVRYHSSCASRHSSRLSLSLLTRSMSFPGHRPCKTSMKGWNYSPSVSTTDMRACLIDSSLHACGHFLRDVSDTPPSPQHTRVLCH